MTGPCFVDANVFVYSRDGREPAKRQRAEQWLDLLWRDRLGRTSTQALSEFYAVATRKLGIASERAWQTAERYFAWNPRPVDEALLRRAREIELRFKISWWDSMIVAAAQLQDCVLLLTEDLQERCCVRLCHRAQPVHAAGERGRSRLYGRTARTQPASSARQAEARGARGVKRRPPRRRPRLRAGATSSAQIRVRARNLLTQAGTDSGSDPISRPLPRARGARSASAPAREATPPHPPATRCRA